MRKLMWQMLREETGTFTLEAAFIVPIVILFICALLFGNILTFRDACEDFANIRKQNAAVERNPGEVIQNTDLGLEYLERLQKAWEEKT